MNENISNNSIQRITKVVNNGTYVFDLQPILNNKYRVNLFFFQFKPLDEAEEKTIIYEELFNNYNDGLNKLYKLIEQEKNRDYVGYYLKITNPVRVKDFASCFGAV